MRISDWSSDVCSSDLHEARRHNLSLALSGPIGVENGRCGALDIRIAGRPGADADPHRGAALPGGAAAPAGAVVLDRGDDTLRSRIVPEGHNHLAQPHLAQAPGTPRPQARKQVVQGKSVAVIVLLGGGRILNKKTNHRQTSNTPTRDLTY